ncbi:MAG TPA: hypothetical protein VKT28_12005 [Puia sp.]|nr:hypothetical protein [Puia sp.]
MRKYLTVILVSLVMIIAILAITNPGRDEEKRMFDHMEGRLTHDYGIFSIYQQKAPDSVTSDGKYFLYKRYIGIGNGIYEISPVKIKRE